jgi:ubiquinone/menaquinone biosynthesis C-methylase UbiE
VEFSVADAYDRFMGRWSQLLAPLLIKFAGIQDGDLVVEVGSGTGSLSKAIIDSTIRTRIVGIDPSASYVENARKRLPNPRLRF